MYPLAFDYCAPTKLDEVMELIRHHGAEIKFLAGGQSLVPLMKLRLARPKWIIDLNNVEDLNHITEDDSWICCGSMTRHVEFEESALIQRKLPLVADAAAHIGDVQVRNRGTIGGALAEADPAGDWGPVVLALNAVMRCMGPRGKRAIEAKEFFNFAYTTSLQDDELLIAIDFPQLPEGAVGCYSKLERITGDFAIVNVALWLAPDGEGRCRDIGIGLGGVGVAPLKPQRVESYLVGKTIDSRIVREACEMLDGEVDPLSDQRGSADYKRRVLKVVFRRSFEEALKKVQQSV